MAFDLTNEGLDFSPPQVSIDALLNGQAPRNQKFFKKKGEAMAVANQLLQNTPQSDFSVSPSSVASVSPGAPAVAAPQPGAAGPTGVEPSDETPPSITFTGGEPQIDTSAQASALPKFIKPTAAEVDHDQAGSPRLTKLGTFLTLLKSAAEGAAVGEGSNRVTPHGVTGNIGWGFEAGKDEPLMEESRQLGVQHQAVENQAERAKIALLPWEVARQRAEVNNMNAHADYLNKHGNYLDQMADQKGKPNIQQQYASAVANAVQNGINPEDDPEVQRLSDAITSIQRPGATKTPTELQTYLSQNPGKTVQDYWNEKAKARSTGSGGKMTELQTWLAQNPGKSVENFWSAKFGANSARNIQSAVVRRSRGMNTLSKFHYDPTSGTYTNLASGETLSQGEYNDAAGRLEDQFDQELSTLGQDPNAVRQHIDSVGGATQANPYRKADVPANPYRKPKS